jgi:hypothetical protein
MKAERPWNDFPSHRHNNFEEFLAIVNSNISSTFYRKKSHLVVAIMGRTVQEARSQFHTLHTIHEIHNVCKPTIDFEYSTVGKFPTGFCTSSIQNGLLKIVSLFDAILN